jgi:hypothetical protein
MEKIPTRLPRRPFSGAAPSDENKAKMFTYAELKRDLIIIISSIPITSSYQGNVLNKATLSIEVWLCCIAVTRTISVYVCIIHY